MNEFIHSISKNNQRVISDDKTARRGSRKGSRKGEAVSDVHGYHELVEYMKDLSVQEILDTKFPNADSSEMYDALPDVMSESDWENVVYPKFESASDAENKMKQACQQAGIDSSMSIDDWYDYQNEHNLSSMWTEGSPINVYNHYIHTGIEKVFGCKPGMYDPGDTSISQIFIDDYERISKPELTESEKHEAFLKYMSTFSDRVDGDAIWKDIKDSPVKKGEELNIYDMIQARASDPYYGDKYLK